MQCYEVINNDNEKHPFDDSRFIVLWHKGKWTILNFDSQHGLWFMWEDIDLVPCFIELGEAQKDHIKIGKVLWGINHPQLSETP